MEFRDCAKDGVRELPPRPRFRLTLEIHGLRILLLTNWENIETLEASYMFRG